MEEEIKNEEVEEEVDLDGEIEVEEDETPDDSEVNAELKRKDDIISQLTARAKKAEALSKKNKLPKEENDGVEELSKTVSQLKLAEEKRQFGFENNLSPDEVDYLFKVNNKPTKELLSDPFIKGGLEALRSQKKIENNTPSASSRSPKFEVPKKENMTAAEKQEAFDKWKESKFGK